MVGVAPFKVIYVTAFGGAAIATGVGPLRAPAGTLITGAGVITELASWYLFAKYAWIRARSVTVIFLEKTKISSTVPPQKAVVVKALSPPMYATVLAALGKICRVLAPVADWTVFTSIVAEGVVA